MRKMVFRILVICSGFCATNAVQAAGGKPALMLARITCASQENPVGVGDARPMLGWEFGSGQGRDRMQTAWQVLVASSPALLTEAGADVWNSGLQAGGSNHHVAIGGKALRSGAAYYWKVRVWDEQRQVSGWSKVGHWTMGLLPGADWGAQWLTDSKPALAEERLLFGDNPAPVFNKEIPVAAGVRRAVLYISGLGYYTASLNGKKIGDHYLDPGWTDFRKTIYYNTYDVTAGLRSGVNSLGVELGNGWYNVLPLRMWGGLNMRKFLAVGTPRFIARLEIEYENGKKTIMVSDDSWKVRDGAWIRNNNYIGSFYDAGHAVGSWRPVRVCESPGGELTAQVQPPIRAGAVIRPVGVRSLGAGKYLVDMGRNFGGILRIQLPAGKGTHVQIRYGELLTPDGQLNVMTSVAGQVKGAGVGGPGAPDIAWQQDDCILGDRPMVFEPAFTFHGFRYAEVTGYPGVLTAGAVEGVPLAADVSQAGQFDCSDSLFNQVQTTCLRTFMSNLFSVQSDCPQREKLGYGGDIVATSEAFMSNFDMQRFYAKAVNDFADEVQPDGALPETAPYVGISDGGVTKTAAPIAWGTVLPLLLWQEYQYYGDVALVKRYYPVAKGWVDFLAAHAQGGIISQCIGDHESLDPKQIEVTSTAYFYYNAKILSGLARVLGNGSDAARYEGLAVSIKDAFIRKFYDAASGAVGIHTEATQAFALYFDLLPSGGAAAAVKVLEDQVVREKKEHISTGIFGTKYLFDVLSEQGLGDLACRVAGQRDFPGWGHMLANGATTLWEHWEYSDNTFSHNHPMFGSISGWFIKYLAGIRPDTNAVGYDRIVFQPGGFGYLKHASASYRSPQGMIRSAWKLAGDSIFYSVTVPVNARARVILPDGSERKIGSGDYIFSWKVGGAVALPLIPYPQQVTETGSRFVIDGATRVVRPAGGKLFATEQGFLEGMLKGYLSGPGGAGGRIVLKYDGSITSEEGYTLNSSGRDLVLSARSGAGMFYAIETLRQLLPAEIEHGHGVSLEMPGVSIKDQPNFGWRGLMLDVSRHFFSMDYLRKYIDMMALYKLNKLHLHLTDDQGWRIEIKKYPRLTSEGAWRTFNNQDSICMSLAAKTDNPDMEIDPAHIKIVNGRKLYGGFYTQEEMKALIRYAGERHIEIIPEVDMPGHMMAAIALYPELTCDGQEGKDWTQGFSTPICPCRENVLEFAKDIFSEIAAIFPSRYIHIGGDEVERSFWKQSPVCAEFMKLHHIETLPQLQSYFNDYMQAFFRSKGKILLGWDEIVEGGIDSSAAVMFWRPWAGTMPAKATANGNKLIMTPDGPFYFDAQQNRGSLAEVYHYDPADKKYGMGERQLRNLLGVQANLWTEWIPTEARANYMVMPRMTALSELAWTHRDRYDDYLKRLEAHYDRLDRLGIQYRLPDLDGVPDRQVFVDTASFMVAPPMRGMTVRYTVDGSWPTVESPVLRSPIRIDHSMTMKVAAFTAGGRRGDVATTVFSQQDLARPVHIDGRSGGLSCGVYFGEFSHVADMKGAVAKSVTLAGPVIPEGMPTTGFGLTFTGYIDVPETGIYSFYLNSDDGSKLWIADRLAVDNDGAHSSAEKGGQVALSKGVHVFLLQYFDGGGGIELGLRYSFGKGAVRPVPVEWFTHGGDVAGAISKRDEHPRIVNIVNFIRWVEPRDPAISHEVLFNTVVRQIELMRASRLPGTFLLQYDALIDPAYQGLLKALPVDSFEIGAWWEIPQQLVEKAGLVWRGRTSWDWRADVGFAAGYSLEDRKKIVDTYMADFKRVFGVYPRSVGSWYVDAYTLDYMYSKYGIRASCNCKDQVGTDGYTLWGGYWNQGYYPSKVSAYMPAQHADKQIPVPMFRMLGSDPLRQYESGLGGGHQGVVTLEPVYPAAGGDRDWINWYFKELVEGACMQYGYVQAGQENSFTWPAMEQGLGIQLPLIGQLRDQGKLRVETLEQTGVWFKERYPLTPATAVTVKEDLPGLRGARKTVWFDSRWYRANLVWDNGHMRFRDIHLFDENMAGDSPAANPSPVSVISTLPFVDGYMWGDRHGAAGLRLVGANGEEISGGDPVVEDSVEGHLTVRWPVAGGGSIVVSMTEEEMRISAEGVKGDWSLRLVTAEGAKLPFVKVGRRAIDGDYLGVKYRVAAKEGVFSGDKVGWSLRPEKGSVLLDLGK